MNSKQRHPVNLKQYRKVEGKWQFVPVALGCKEEPGPVPRSRQWRAGQLERRYFLPRIQAPWDTPARARRDGSERGPRSLEHKVRPSHRPDRTRGRARDSRAGIDDLSGNRESSGRGGSHQRREDARAVPPGTGVVPQALQKRFVSQLSRSDAMSLFEQGRKGEAGQKCDTSPRCGNWYLHKFRHTFATNMLQSVDIRSLQVMLGHKNTAATEKCLKSLRLDQLRDKIESSASSA